MEEVKQNPLGTMPVPRLLVTMSAPIMLSMLVQALYNIVDSIFVIRLSEDAFTAVSLAFPIQNLLIAVSVGTAVGVNSLISRRLGEKNTTDANLAANNGMMLAFVSSIAFLLFAIFGSRLFFEAFTDDPTLVQMGIDYLRVVCGFPFGVFFSVMGERFVQMTGSSIYSMVGQMVGAVVNIILDPIMIFGLLGCPRLEVAGAAIATVIGQVCGAITVFYFNYKKNHELTLSFSQWKPNRRIIADIYRVGLPSIIMQAIGSFMTFGMNKILIMFSSVAVNVFGAYFKLQSFIFMPVFGLNNGMVPIVGYNFGARKKERIFASIKLSLIIAALIMLVGVLVFQFLPGVLLKGLFDASDEMLTMGVPALRIISISFIPAALAITLSGCFQAVGVGIYSLIMSFTRQLVVLLPTAFILGRLIGVSAVWWSFPIAEIVAIVLSLSFYKRIYDRSLKLL